MVGFFSSINNEKTLLFATREFLILLLSWTSSIGDLSIKDKYIPGPRKQVQFVPNPVYGGQHQQKVLLLRNVNKLLQIITCFCFYFVMETFSIPPSEYPLVILQPLISVRSFIQRFIGIFCVKLNSSSSSPRIVLPDQSRILLG